ncbi:MAG: hypothetical protein EBR18_03960 [Betaproteobacteria bacterium]|nr:hypothetical protein [Betaproteobacteria bacterium]
MPLTRSPLAAPGRAVLLNVLILAAWCLPLQTHAQDPAPMPTVKLSPAARITPLDEEALSDNTLKLLRAMVGQLVFLSEEQVQGAARIVAGPPGRVLFGAGDRIYAADADFAEHTPPLREQRLRIFREAGPLKDPQTGAVLGQETLFLGNAVWVSGAGLMPDTDGADKAQLRVPASLDIVSSQREIMVGDRVLVAQTEPPDTIRPHWPSQPVSARVVRLYGMGQQEATQHQIITINKGRLDGIETGHLLNIMLRQAKIRDKKNPPGESLQLPPQRNGTALVFSTFERFAYALITESQEGVREGDVLTGP